MSICKWKMKTQLCLWEYTNPRGRFVHCLQDPKTSSPSKCDVLDVKDEAYFAIVTTICNGLLKPFILCKWNSILFKPYMDGPPFKYSLYNELCLKDHTFSLKVVVYKR
jgi:hypothetical protein